MLGEAEVPVVKSLLNVQRDIEHYTKVSFLKNKDQWVEITGRVTTVRYAPVCHRQHCNER